MRALLDDSLPRPLARHFHTLEVETVHSRGWAGLTNGALLRSAASEFDLFLTADQNLRYQQHLAGYDIGVIVLAAVSNRLPDLLPPLPQVEALAPVIRSGEVRVVRGELSG